MSENDPVVSGAHSGKLAAEAPWPMLLLVGSAIVFVLAYRLLFVLSGDVTWLLSCAEWLLDGRQMSVDFFEVNPPGSVMIYLPAAILARALPLSADITLQIMVFLLAAANARLIVTRVLCAGSGPGVMTGLTAILVLVLLVYPGRDFAQREHIVVLLLLPWLVLAARPDLPASRILRCAAGIALGGVVMAKPYFVIVPVAVELFRLARTRDIKALFNLQNIVAILAGLAYVASIYLLFPAYLTNVLPHVLAIYAPLQWPVLAILSSVEPMVCITFIGLAILTRARGKEAIWAYDAVLIASIFSLIAALLQLKGFRYHFVPAITLSILAAALNACSAYVSGKSTRLAVAGSMTLLVVLCVGHTIGTDDLDANKRAQNLAQVVRGLGPAPRVLGISADNEVAFPVTRLVKGTFVQRQPFLWMAASAARIQSLTPETQWRNQLYTRYYALEREILIEDITKGKPDVILIDIPEWAVLSRFMLDARLAELLSRYRQIATVDDVAVYALKP